MGNEQSKKDEMIKIVDNYNYEKDGVVSEKEFVDLIFQRLDNAQGHTDAGPLIVSGTHVLKALYQHLATMNKGLLTKCRVTEVINKIYDKSQKSIEYSYRIIQGGNDKNITRKQFIDFVLHCYDKGLNSILKHTGTDSLFKKSFREWAKTNRIAIIQETDSMFTSNAQVEKEAWTMGDFKRWIINQEHWMIYISIKDEIYRVPLNIPCLFGVKLQLEK